MPFLTRNENQSHVRYAAPPSPMIAITGAPATAATPAPIAAAAANVPLRLDTTLFRCTRELTSGGCTTNYPLSNRRMAPVSNRPRRSAGEQTHAQVCNAVGLARRLQTPGSTREHDKKE